MALKIKDSKPEPVESDFEFEHRENENLGKKRSMILFADKSYGPGTRQKQAFSSDVFDYNVPFVRLLFNLLKYYFRFNTVGDVTLMKRKTEIIWIIAVKWLWLQADELVHRSLKVDGLENR